MGVGVKQGRQAGSHLGRVHAALSTCRFGASVGRAGAGTRGPQRLGLNGRPEPRTVWLADETGGRGGVAWETAQSMDGVCERACVVAHPHPTSFFFFSPPLSRSAFRALSHSWRELELNLHLNHRRPSKAGKASKAKQSKHAGSCCSSTAPRFTLTLTIAAATFPQFAQLCYFSARSTLYPLSRILYTSSPTSPLVPSPFPF